MSKHKYEPQIVCLVRPEEFFIFRSFKYIWRKSSYAGFVESGEEFFVDRVCVRVGMNVSEWFPVNVT